MNDKDESRYMFGDPCLAAMYRENQKRPKSRAMKEAFAKAEARVEAEKLFQRSLNERGPIDEER